MLLTHYTHTLIQMKRQVVTSALSSLIKNNCANNYVELSKLCKKKPIFGSFMNLLTAIKNKNLYSFSIIQC